MDITITEALKLRTESIRCSLRNVRHPVFVYIDTGNVIKISDQLLTGNPVDGSSPAKYTIIIMIWPNNPI